MGLKASRAKTDSSTVCGPWSAQVPDALGHVFSENDKIFRQEKKYVE